MKIEKLREKAIKLALQTPLQAILAKDILTVAEEYLTFLQFGLNPKNNIVNYPPRIGYYNAAGSIYDEPIITYTGTSTLTNDLSRNT